MSDDGEPVAVPLEKAWQRAPLQGGQHERSCLVGSAGRGHSSAVDLPLCVVAAGKA